MIKIEINREKGISTGKLSQRKTQTLSNKIVSLLAKNRLNTTIEIFFVSRGKIKKLNTDFRQVSSETDVLAFPLNYISSAKEKVLGTIFIAPQIAEEKDEKLEELIEHGILHLLGFDHEKKPKEWQKIENKLGKDEK